MAILINSQTRVLVQGITGREAASFTLESLRYGTRIEAGVSPEKGGHSVHGIPVFDTVKAALREHPCDATVISVPARFALDACLEALEHGIRLLLLITERIPRRDVVAIMEAAQSCGARVIGPNSLGVITPGEARIGMCGGAVSAIRRAYTPGRVGVASRSGGMMTEIANLLTRAGVGQSTCVSVGGVPIIGTDFLDLLALYERDEQTGALVLFCEPGGSMEERLAEHVTRFGTRLKLVAFVAGRFTDVMQGIRFGHAAAIVEGTRGSPHQKIRLLRDAGIDVAERLSEIPNLLLPVSAGEQSGPVH